LDNKFPSHNFAVAGFVVLTAVVTKFQAFCDVTQYPKDLIIQFCCWWHSTLYCLWNRTPLLN